MFIIIGNIDTINVIISVSSRNVVRRAGFFIISTFCVFYSPSLTFTLRWKHGSRLQVIENRGEIPLTHGQCKLTTHHILDQTYEVIFRLKIFWIRLMKLLRLKENNCIDQKHVVMRILISNTVLINICSFNFLEVSFVSLLNVSLFHYYLPLILKLMLPLGLVRFQSNDF